MRTLINLITKSTTTKILTGIIVCAIVIAITIPVAINISNKSDKQTINFNNNTATDKLSKEKESTDSISKDKENKEVLGSEDKNSQENSNTGDLTSQENENVVENTYTENNSGQPSSSENTNTDNSSNTYIGYGGLTYSADEQPAQRYFSDGTPFYGTSEEFLIASKQHDIDTGWLHTGDWKEYHSGYQEYKQIGDTGYGLDAWGDWVELAYTTDNWQTWY